MRKKALCAPRARIVMGEERVILTVIWFTDTKRGSCRDKKRLLKVAHR